MNAKCTLMNVDFTSETIFTATMLAVISEADDVLKTIKVIENTCLDNKFITEGLDIDLKATVIMASGNMQRLDGLSRNLDGGQALNYLNRAELKRST